MYVIVMPSLRIIGPFHDREKAVGVNFTLFHGEGTVQVIHDSVDEYLLKTYIKKTPPAHND